MLITLLKRQPGTDGGDEKDGTPLAQLVDRSMESVVHSPTPSADHTSESAPSHDALTDLIAALTLLLQLQGEQMARSTPPVATTVQHPRDPPWLSMDVPKYTGYSDSQSVATFIDSLRDYQAASGITDEMVVTRLQAAAYTGSAAMWRRRQPDFESMDDFVTRFKAEFLPPGYVIHIKDELRERTQHPDEPLKEFLKALQGLYDLADPTATDSEKVIRAIHQSNPRFHAHLRG